MTSLSPVTAGLYDPLGEADGYERFGCTEGVRSTWGPMQHGSPVAGLLTRALERTAPRGGTRLARVTVDLLGPVPLADLRTRAHVVRPGRRIELLEAVLEADVEGSWRPVARAQAWRLATRPTDDVQNRPGIVLDLPTADEGLQQHPLPESWREGGFVEALEWRGARLSQEPGCPSTVWLRMRHPLVSGETTSPTVLAVTVTDVANGVGARLDPFAFTFLNTDLTVQLVAPPRGPWFAITAETLVGPDGVALSQGTLHDADGGLLGRIAQTVLVERRAG